MKCERCNHGLFKIQKNPCCDDCLENGAWDEFLDEFTDDLKLIDASGLERDRVSETGECNLGIAYGEGCHVYICDMCNHKTHLPMIQGC